MQTDFQWYFLLKAKNEFQIELAKSSRASRTMVTFCQSDVSLELEFCMDLHGSMQRSYNTGVRDVSYGRSANTAALQQCYCCFPERSPNAFMFSSRFARVRTCYHNAMAKRC